MDLKWFRNLIGLHDSGTARNFMHDDRCLFGDVTGLQVLDSACRLHHHRPERLPSVRSHYLRRPRRGECPYKCSRRICSERHRDHKSMYLAVEDSGNSSVQGRDRRWCSVSLVTGVSTWTLGVEGCQSITQGFCRAQKRDTCASTSRLS
jgi:hypothetical protein